MDRRFALIVNPSAGGGRAARALPAVEARLRALDLPFHIDQTRSLEHAIDLARAAAGAGEVAVAFGGDGLAGAVAGALAGRDGVLGVLPGGRGNDFIRVLGVPFDPVEACDVLAHGKERPLDLGECGGRSFIGIASCGFDSDANRIANEAKLIKGNLVYAYGALRALAAWKPATFEVVMDGDRTHVVTGFSVGACNNKAYGGGMYAAPEAEFDDGLFDVITCARMSKRRFLFSLMPKTFKGAHIHEPEISVFRAKEVTVSANRPFTMYADGDPIAELPATLRILHHAVRVIGP